MLLSGYVRNLATTEADIAAAVAASGLDVDEWMASYPRMLGQLADPRRFPALTAFIAAGVFDGADEPDDEFAFGLDRILDGVGVLVGGLCLRRNSVGGQWRPNSMIVKVRRGRRPGGDAGRRGSGVRRRVLARRPGSRRVRAWCCG
jgi:hypothetical protein